VQLFWREAVSRAEPGTGCQIQSVRAIGQCFAAAARTGLTINASEQHNCVLTLQAYLDDETPDQVFSVALRSLGRIQRIDEDDRLRSAILKATSSVSDLRREAAMMVLYSSCVSLDDEALGNIRSASESDPSLVVRQLATAVLEKHKTAPVADQHQN